jgi:hypothetical protein
MVYGSFLGWSRGSQGFEINFSDYRMEVGFNGGLGKIFAAEIVKELESSAFDAMAMKFAGLASLTLIEDLADKELKGFEFG